MMDQPFSDVIPMPDGRTKRHLLLLLLHTLLLEKRGAKENRKRILDKIRLEEMDQISS